MPWILPSRTTTRYNGGIWLAIVAYAAFGATFASHSTGALIAVLAPAVLVLALAAPTPSRPRHRPQRRHFPWLVLLLTFGLWELVPLLLGDLTISLLLDPVLAIYPLRVAAWVLWLWVGWQLVRR
jgi:hypothetical protein